MPCLCKKCGQPTECDFSICMNCYLEMSDDDVSKNIVSGGQFYGEKLEKESEE